MLLMTGVACAQNQNLNNTPSLSHDQSSTSPNGVLNEELYSGVSVAARVNTAVAACGTHPCYIVIPPNAPSGAGWTTPLPNNVFINDERLFNGIGFAGGPFPFLTSYNVIMQNLGVNTAGEGNANSGRFVLDLESEATAGGVLHDASKANAGGLLVSTRRTGGNRPLWGADFSMVYNNINNGSVGIEIDDINGSGVDAPVGSIGNGIVVIASGPNSRSRSGIGYTCQAVVNGTSWQYCQLLQSYTTFGTFYSGATGRSADISIIPPADDTSTAIVGRNHANTASVFFILANGQGGFSSLVPSTGTAIPISGIRVNNHVTAGTGMQHFRANLACSTGAAVGATCTSGALTWPVAFPDTSYSVVCTPNSITGVPTVVGTTNISGSQFTITIAALTAASAAAHVSCIGMHD